MNKVVDGPLAKGKISCLQHQDGASLV